MADLQFRNRFEYAVGHGVSVAVEPAADGGPVTTVRATVPRVGTGPVVGVTAMEELARLENGEDLRRALEPIPIAYGAWIATQREIDPGTDPRRATRDDLMDEADRACRRIAEGINLLEHDEEARLHARRRALHPPLAAHPPGRPVS